MPVRALLAVPTILLFAAMLPAQLGVGPILVQPLAFNQGLTPVGAVRTSDITIQDLGNGNHFVGISYHTSFAGQPQARSYTYNAPTNTLTLRPDFNSLPPGIDALAISPDLLNVAAYQLGIGQRMFQRNSVTAPFGPGSIIQNLSPIAFGLEFCMIKGNPHLLALFNDPLHSSIEIYRYDPVANSISNPRNFNPPLGHPSNFPAFAIAMDDSLGETRGLAVCIRQPLGFLERCMFTPGVDGTAPWMDWFDPPANSYLIGGDQLDGGHLIGVNGLAFGPLPGGSIDMVGAFTFGAIGSTQGGSVALTMMGPPGGFGVFAIATNLVPSVTVPGFLNEFGLNAGGIIGTFFLPMPDGVGEVTLAHPATSPFVVPTQSVSFDTTFVMLQQAFGNTAELGFQQ